MNTDNPNHLFHEISREGRRLLKYLQLLGVHNTKERFHDKENQKEYQYVRTKFKGLVGLLKEELMQFDPTIMRIPIKKIIYRINRDIRYSRDKSPYKRNFGALFAQKGGTQSKYAGYYLHIEPGNNSFVGGGLYYPEKNVLDTLRVHLEYEGKSFTNILHNDLLVDFFGSLQGRSLKTWPRGYSKRTPNLSLIRKKDFYLTYPLNDKKIIDGRFYKEVVKGFKILYPFISALNEPLQLEDIE